MKTLCFRMYDCKYHYVLAIYKCCLRLDYSKRQKQKKGKEKKSKLLEVWAIPIPISTTKDVICCCNGYIYHFLDYIKLLLFVNANVIHHV